MNANPSVEIRIDYAKPRRDKLPPTIQAGDTSYTVNDAAFPLMLAAVGETGDLEYYTNDRGYHVAVGWNGQRLPSDKPRNGNAPPRSSAPRPSAPSASSAPAADPSRLSSKDKLDARAKIAAAALASGLPAADAVKAMQAAWDWTVGRTAASAPPAASSEVPF